MATDKQINQAISDFIMRVFLKERYIELKRQQLCDMDDFEPYVAYNRLVRNQFGGITAKNLKIFLEENSVITTLAKCEVIVDQYNANQNQVLSYKEFLDIVLPKEHPDLRAFVTQRECFDINKDEYLSYDTEVALSNLFDLEINLYEELVEEKKKLDNLGIDVKDILSIINKGSPGCDSINFASTKSYIEDCGINTYDFEIINFIRRFDQNDDGIVEQGDVSRFFGRIDSILRQVDLSRRGIVGTSREAVRDRSPLRKIVSTKVTLVKSKKKKANKSVAKSRRDDATRVSVGLFEVNNDKENKNMLNRIVDSVEKYKRKKGSRRETIVGLRESFVELKEASEEPKQRNSQAYNKSMKVLRESSLARHLTEDSVNPRCIRGKDSFNVNLFSSKKNTLGADSITMSSLERSFKAQSTKILENTSTNPVIHETFDSLELDSEFKNQIRANHLLASKLVGESKQEPVPRISNQMSFNGSSKGKTLNYTNSITQGDFNSIEGNIFKSTDINVNNLIEMSIGDTTRRASIYMNDNEPLIIRKADTLKNTNSISKNILNHSTVSTSIGKSSVCNVDDVFGSNNIGIMELEKKKTNSEMCLFTEKLIEILDREGEIDDLKKELFQNDGFCLEEVFQLIDSENKGQFGFEEFREFIKNLGIEGIETRSAIDFFGSFDIHQNCYLTFHEFSRIFYPQSGFFESKASEESNQSLDFLDQVREILQAQFNIRKLINKAKQLISDNKIDVNMLFDYFDVDNKGFTAKEEIYDFLKSISYDVSIREIELFISRCTYGEDIHELSFKEFYIFFSL